MFRLVEALTHDDFKIRDEMIDYRMKYAVRDDVRAAYSATMEWVKSSGGLAWDEDYIRQVSAPTLVVNGTCDKVIPLAHASRFLALIPKSSGYIIDRKSVVSGKSVSVCVDRGGPRHITKKKL